MQTRDNKITNKLVRQGKLPKSQMEIHPQKFSKQQIGAIKRSPAGKLPKFISASIGMGKAPGVRSIGANVQVGKKNLGGSLGVNKGKLFGTLNVNHKKAKSFGPKKHIFKSE